MIDHNWIERMKGLRVVAFDADDTLWDCQTHFDRVTHLMCDLLAPWADHDTAWRELLATERQNLSLTGYGCKAYILSVIETALRVSRHEICAADIDKLLEVGNGLLKMSVPPLPDVEQTLSAMRLRIDELHLPLRLVVFTKGELMDQQNKLVRSGLAPLFDFVEITSDKREQQFLSLCEKLIVRPAELLMVGNSFKSDIAPALAIGSAALHIPFSVQWEMEHSEPFDHPFCRCLSHFGEVITYVFPT